MFKIICVTNRKLCSDFFSRLAAINKMGVEVILREKDLSEAEYIKLAEQSLKLCPDITFHTYIAAAEKLGVKRIHLPFHLMNENIKFDRTGVSVHSTKEAEAAERMGADYIIAGHIFATDCKKGLQPRGTEFLRSVVNSVNIPVFAIGGITPENIMEVRESGASGACVMSGLMQCASVEEYLSKYLIGE